MAEQLMPQNPETQQDLLEQLLAGAAERETQKAMAELAQKGTVTKAEFGTALAEFENRISEKIESFLATAAEKVQKAAPAPAEESETEEPVKKAARKGTLSESSDPRSDNPVKYLINKSRKNEDYDDVDKILVWELTRKALTQGMSTQEIDDADFGDEY